MKILPSLVLGFSLGLVVAACGDDDSGNGTDATVVDGSVTGDGSTTGDAAVGDAAVVPDANVADLVTLTGTANSVVLEGESTNLAGVTVSVLNVPSAGTATTDANGDYSLMIPAGPQFILFEAADHWGYMYAVNFAEGEAGTQNGEMVPDSIAAMIEEALEVTFDTAKGIVFFNFAEGVTPSKTADLSASYNGSFTFSSDGPVAGDTTLEGGENFVAFHGVTVGTTTATLTDGCAPAASVTEWPVRADTFTHVFVECN